MGLDQKLYWIGRPSKDQVRRLRHKNLSEFDYTIGMQYISQSDYEDRRFDYIRDYMISEEVYVNNFDWELMKSDCGMPEDAHICGIGPTSVAFGQAMNVGEVKKFYIDMYDKRYRKSMLITQYFYLEDELFYWRKNYEIQELFNTNYPDEWDAHKQKYQIINCRYYPIKNLLDSMLLIDSEFEKQYHEGTDNVFYQSNW